MLAKSLSNNSYPFSYKMTANYAARKLIISVVTDTALGSISIP